MHIRIHLIRAFACISIHKSHQTLVWLRMLFGKTFINTSTRSPAASSPFGTTANRYVMVLNLIGIQWICFLITYVIREMHLNYVLICRLHILVFKWFLSIRHFVKIEWAKKKVCLIWIYIHFKWILMFSFWKPTFRCNMALWCAIQSLLQIPFVR